MKYIHFFDEFGQNDIQLAGGKGASLGEMTQAGFPVPPGFVITTDAYRDFQNRTFPQTFQEELLIAFEKLNTNYVAVRSSAVAEDSTEASWAGQLESYLYIDKNHLINAVKNCSDSIHSKRAHMYANEKKVPDSKLLVAVVIQKMVNSKASGVMFTVTPVTSNRDELMIEAGYGLGDLLVQGEITPDNYVLNKKTAEVKDILLGSQNKMMVFQKNKLTTTPLPEQLKQKQVLNEKQIIDLCKLGIKIENHYESPQDIEWALENHTFYIVQSRPITTLKI